MKKPTFMLLDDGSLYASNANISGTISASEGDIAGWLIKENGLFNGYTLVGDYYQSGIVLKPNATSEVDDAIACGRIKKDFSTFESNFRVTHEGKMYVKNIEAGTILISENGLETIAGYKGRKITLNKERISFNNVFVQETTSDDSGSE
jgi:predicted secreted protein